MPGPPPRDRALAEVRMPERDGACRKNSFTTRTCSHEISGSALSLFV
jgi:hypothetical protein